jgi:probable addiction module antidote protein
MGGLGAKAASIAGGVAVVNAGMSREGIYKALSGEGNPSFATIVKVAGALGLRLQFKPM